MLGKIKVKFLAFLVYLYLFVHEILLKMRVLKEDNVASARAGGSAIMMLIMIFIAGVIGLALTPSFITFSIQASWAYNGTTWATVAQLFYVFVIPILYAIIMIMMLIGASVGAYKVGKKLV